MTDLKLVPPDQPTPLEQLLLNAAANESPSAEQRQRVRLALGLPAVAVAPTPPVSKLALRATWLKVGAASVVVASAALWWLGRGTAPVAPAPLAKPTPVATAIVAPTVVTEATPAVPAPVAPLVPAAPPSLKPVARSTPSAASTADLGEELKLIESARAAVARGDAAAASSALGSYASRFPRGAFGQEASVLRIKTLELQGNHAQASSLAKAFIARHPNSPHVGVLQRIAQ